MAPNDHESDKLGTKDALLNRLHIERDTIVSKLHRFISFVNDAGEQDVLELESRLEHVSVIMGQFDTVQTQIESLDVAQINSDNRDIFEKSYFKGVSSAKNKILHIHSDIQKTVAENNATVTTPATPIFQGRGPGGMVTSRFCLPPIDLPIFDGDHKKWIFFFQRFSALVDQNGHLSSVEKLYYLQGRLKGEAEKLIQELELNDANYDVALKLLQERYENKRVVIDKHIEELFDIPAVTTESALTLRNLIDSFKQYIRSLKALGEPTDSWDRLLIQLIKIKLDSRTRERWHEFSHTQSKKDPPTLKEFLDFLVSRCECLESKNRVNSFQSSQQAKPHNKNFIPKRNTVANLAVTNAYGCAFCKETDHYIYSCKKFLNLAVTSRQNEIKKLGLCANCFRSNHSADSCTRGVCKVCQNKHNTLLHSDNFKQSLQNTHLKDTQSLKSNNANSSKNRNYQNSRSTHLITQDHGSEFSNDNETQDFNHTDTQNNLVTEQENSSQSCSLVSHCTPNKQTRQNILLSTVSLFVKDKTGNLIRARALLDSGSQSNIITKSLVEKLGLQTQSINLPLVGVNQSSSHISEQVNAIIKSRFNSFEIKLSFLILKQISGNIPNFSINRNTINIPENLTLGDPDFDKINNIDILLGAEVFYDLLCVGQYKLGVNQPILQKTKFGWIVSGPITKVNSNEYAATCNLITVSSLEDKIEAFWRVEEQQPIKKFTEEEMQCENHFAETVQRTRQGRFKATLPIRDTLGDLGNSKQNALKRFYKLENKLSKDSNLHQQYVDFLTEYEQLGHMSKLQEWEIDSNNKDIYYLPHHGVLKDDSVTTKLRVVFDASAKTDNGISLNDKLMVGPTIQEDLFSIIVRFRQHNFVIVADITKMYRQVEITENQRNLQRILWRTAPDLPLCHYTLNTVTYGTASASFIAIRCLHQLAIENQNKFPLAAEAIKRDFYVDDLITGADTIENAQMLKRDITQILDSGGFPLRKWKTNEQKIFTDDVICSTELPAHYLSPDLESKTLGLIWNSKADTLSYKINIIEIKNITKRSILSVIAQIFDTLGLIGPVITKAKVMMQKLWQLQISWDESVPLAIATEFTQFQRELHVLADIKIPRQISGVDSQVLEVHAFCDSSNISYGGCLYLRTVNSLGKCTVRLICAKSRVAPLKVLTLPRLELSAAVLLANLTVKVTDSLSCNISNIFYYTDSTIVLAWIKTEPALFKTFVSNRVAEIQKLTKIENWQHVKSEDNPADVISRGLLPSQLKDCGIWWNGPRFLNNNEYLPKLDNHTPLAELPEVKRSSLSNVIIYDNSLFERFSNFDRLNKVVAWILRFKHNVLSDKGNRKFGPLDISELKHAKQTIIKVVQMTYFGEDISRLRKGKTIKKKSKLSTLNPFVNNNLLRVGGRISKAKFPHDKKFPLILPHNSHVTRLLIEREHKLMLHAGAQATLASLRNVYWPLRGKSVVRQILHNCITCFRAHPSACNEKMGDLPKFRLTQIRPFFNSGVDYAGPFLVKEVKHRNKRLVKVYLCIFICMATRAVHLEIAGDLTSDTFLNVLKRFVSRRGICRNLYSDNGGCFVGANNDLKSFIRNISEDKAINTFFKSNEIAWHFIPANSPHMGGSWEAAVRSAKYHLKRVIGQNHLCLEDFNTLCIQVEAILNSRPLIPLTDDPNDLSPLTPGHFIIGDVLTSIPQMDVRELKFNRLTAYNQLQQMYQHFWSRWRNEYVSHLQQRVKWKQQSDTLLKIGSMVLLKEDNTPPLCWPLGRITQLHPGDDGIVRVVSVKTKNNVVKRAVARICVLPIFEH